MGYQYRVLSDGRYFRAQSRRDGTDRWMEINRGRESEEIELRHSLVDACGAIRHRRYRDEEAAAKEAGNSWTIVPEREVKAAAKRDLWLEGGAGDP